MKLMLLFTSLLLAAVSCEQARTIMALQGTMAEMSRNKNCMVAEHPVPPHARPLPQAPRAPLPEPESEPMPDIQRSLVLI